MNVTTAERLDQFLKEHPCQCGKPFCEGDEIWLSSKCHTGEGLYVHYKKGIMTIMCRICEKEVLKVRVM